MTDEFMVRPTPDDPRLSVTVAGIDQTGAAIETAVVTERPLTLFLNAREIVTMMTIGDHPDLLAVGYLLNQNMLRPDDEITAIEHAEDIDTIVVRTKRQTDYEEKLRKKTQTSGCAQGTIFGDLMEEFDKIKLNTEARLKTSWLYTLARKINTEPSLYLKAGAIHGCVLAQEDRVLVYMAIYVVMTLGTFGIILMMRRQGRYIETISDLAGLSRRQPLMAAALAIFMFSMAGVPPLAGFFGKLFVFMAAVKAGLYLLAIIGVVASVVGAFYYLRIIKTI